MTRIRNFDAEFCGKIPLHQTNLIQPHGVLLVIKKDDLTVIQGSENVDAVFAIPVTSVVGNPLSTFLPEDDLVRFSTLFSSRFSGKMPFSFSVNGRKFLSLVEAHQLYYILEIDKESFNEGEERSFLTVYQEVKIAMSAIDACITTEETGEVVARELKKLSGFDKVMVYSFDKDWNGDVLAEEMEPGMDTYLGLKFPASDIPKSARDLYKKQPYRLIPDSNAEPVRIYPVINPLTNSFTDLSTCNLRSVAGVHREYLRNMNVDASMSIRILKDGELWGLIACHHRSPKYLSYEMCSVLELLSNVISAKISAMQNSNSFQYKVEKQNQQQKVINAILKDGGLAGEKKGLLQLLDADGIAISNNYIIETVGATPAPQEIEDLVFWLQANSITTLYHQTSLPSVYEAAESYADRSSGLLALPVETEKGDFVLAFRQEAVQTVSWGGDPNEALKFDSDKTNYHPRASFKIWQQTVRQTATSWRPETLEIAESLRNFLVESRLNQKY